MKKILTVIMAVVMVMTLTPAAAFAGISEDGNSYILEENETWNSESFKGDVYIPQGYTLNTTGETAIEGDIYNFGTLNNKGNLSVSGTLNCLYYAMNGITMSAGDYDHGELISGGRLNVGTLNVKDDFLSVPIPEIHRHTYGDWITDKATTCTESGARHKVCISCGDTVTETIPATGHTYKTQTKKATATKNGYIKKVCSCGDVKSTSKIYYPKTVKLSTSTYTYNGKIKKPSVKVYNSAGKLISASNYTVKYATGRKSVGKYKVTVTFKSTSKYYTGSKYAYFKINPKSTYLSKVTAGNKAFTAKWKKQSAQTTGYQLMYSPYSSFKSGKTLLVSGSKTVSKTVKSLKAGKKYYVKIRTYKTVKGVKYYSTWSKAKTVKTKVKVSKPAPAYSSNTVYITQTGSKYHYNKNCRGLSNARKVIPTTLSKAKADGYELCGYED